MTVLVGPRSFARPYRLRFHRRAETEPQEPQVALQWADISADPAARMRAGSLNASDGAKIPYRYWHAPDARAAVLLLHGAFDYSAAFDEIGPKLARRGFAALAIDQRGFGATASRGAWAGVARMAKDANDAAAFLLARMERKIPLFLLGESMGGAIAVHAAAASEDPHLQGLVLAAPGALASAVRQRLLAVAAIIARALAGNAELVFERLSGWELTPSAAVRLIGDPLVMRHIRPEMLSGMADLASRALDRARMVDVPVLALVGARDEIIPRSCSRRLFDNLAGEKAWRVIPDAPHLLLHWRRSGEVLREAACWMSEHLAARAGSDAATNSC